MKKLTLSLLTGSLVAIVAAVAMSSTSLNAAPQRKNLDFTLVNKTGVALMEVYLSPSNDDKWGEDVMGNDILADKEKVDITFSSAETACNWDLKVIDEDDDEIVWTKLNLCTAVEITLLWENKKPTAITRVAMPPASAGQSKNLDFTLVNRTGVVIMEVYLSPTTDDKWGEDVMGNDILADKEKVDITFSSAETACNWDLKVIDEGHDEIVWTKLNLCTANEITLLWENKKPTAIIK